MKPRFLRISGLNSFNEEQIIDFSRLTEKGLFGIFGPTGSGKSTILDAITMALYDHIPRNTKEYINTDCESLYVSYEFEISGVNGSKSYRVERSKKRNKNGGVNTDFARLCFLDKDGNEEKVFDKISEIDEEIKNIIGLNHHDFTRSVVLPQGKFSDFLKLTGSDRNKMLERILSLEKYGRRLYDRIKNTRNINATDIKVLEEKLGSYKEISKDALDELKKDFNKKLNEKEELERKNKILQEKYEKLSKLWYLQQELISFNEEEKELELQSEGIEEKRKKFILGTRANGVKPYMDNLDETTKSIDENKEGLEKIINKIEELELIISKIEKDYKVVEKEKNDEVPILIENETKIKRAITLLEQVKGLVEEKEKLKEELEELNNKIKIKTQELQAIEKKKEDYNKKLDKNTLEMKNLKVTSEYREELSKAWELQKTYNKLLKEEKEDKDKLKSIKDHIAEKNKKLNDLNNELNNNNDLLKKEQERIIELNETKPRSREDIIHQGFQLEKSRIKLQEAIEDNKSLKAIEKELKEIVDKKTILSNELKASRENLTEATKKLEAVNKEVLELEEIHGASIISSKLEAGSPCPVCGSKEHPSPAKEIDNEAIKEKKEIAKALQGIIDKTQEQAQSLEFEIKLLVKDEERKKQELEGYMERLKDIDIDQIEKQNKLMANEIIINNEKLDKWEQEYEKATKKVEDMKETNSTLIPKIAALKESTNMNSERINEIAENLQAINNNISEASEELENNKRSLKVENIEQELLIVKENDKKLEKLEKDNEDLREELKVLEEKKERINSFLRDSSIEKSKKTEQYNEKNKSIDNNLCEIKNIVGEENPHLALEKTINRKNHILKKEEELKNHMEKQKGELNRLQEMKSGKVDSIHTLEKSLTKIHEELLKALEENELATVEEARINILPKEELQELNKQIQIYDKEAQRIRSNIERIHQELDGEVIQEEEWEELRNERENTINSYNRILEEIGQEKERIKEMEKDLKESNKLKKELKALEYKGDMLRDMFSLVSGNKFVEFVAISHLKYIAKEASKRLMDITNNRYSLELDNSGSFIICDNYNGGVRRDCNTLSGGETFVTSLALALSLSTQVQLKGKTAFEFFFLDEGFGTLDSHLLDTVMNSLERLHEERLSVGIISHVEELKNRIPVKLVVTPSEAGLHGTKVRLESS